MSAGGGESRENRAPRERARAGPEEELEEDHLQRSGERARMDLDSDFRSIPSWPCEPGNIAAPSPSLSFLTDALGIGIVFAF